MPIDNLIKLVFSGEPESFDDKGDKDIRRDIKIFQDDLRSMGYCVSLIDVWQAWSEYSHTDMCSSWLDIHKDSKDRLDRDIPALMKYLKQ